MEVVQRLKDLAISEAGFVFDPHTGTTFSLNPTGRQMLEGLAQGRDRERIVEGLHDSFDIPPGEDLDRDLSEFVLVLRRQGLVPPEFTV
jgi:hypothetical protein